MPVIHDKQVAEPSSVMTFLRGFFSRFDLLQIIPVTVLLLFGIFFVYGTGQQVGGVNVIYWHRQIQWAVFGLSAWGLLTFIDYRKLGFLFALMYPMALIMLVFVLLFGVSQFGAKRWLSLFGTSFQPAEFAKLITIVFCAWLCAQRNFDVNRWRWGTAILAVAVIPALLILRQPNLSTALTLILCAAAIVFTARIKWRWILAILAAAAIAAPAGYSMLRPYHRARIMVFLNPGMDPLNKGWNQHQAELAVGSGGTFGKGFMQGTQNSLGFLPQTVTNSDFIFSVIAEETGFAGSLFLLMMYGMLLFSIFRCAMMTTDEFGCYLCVGIGTMIAIHSIVNIGMSLRLMPVTGIPLPLVSYGGTFLFMTLSALGLVQSVYAHSFQTNYAKNENQT